MNSREVRESPITQGKDEQVAYTLTTTPWGSTPTSIAVTIANSAGTDTSSTNLSGSASAVGDVITTPKVISLTSGEVYRMEIKFTCSGNIFEPYVIIYAQD